MKQNPFILLCFCLSFYSNVPNVVHTFYNILICPFKKESCGRYSVQLITTLNMSSQFMHLIGFIICHVSPELCTFMYFYLFFVSNVCVLPTVF